MSPSAPHTATLAIFFLICAPPASAADFSVERLCQALSVEASNMYGTLQKLDTNFPGDSEANARLLTQASYEAIKKKKLENVGAEKWWDSVQSWREIGITHYKNNNTFTKPEIERILYKQCIGGSK